MKFKKNLKKYAEVLIKIGIGLKRGQPLFIEAPLEAADFLPVLMETAYSCGSGKIYVFWNDEAVNKIRAVYGDEEPSDAEWRLINSFAERGAGFLRLQCPSFDEEAMLSAEQINRMTLIHTKRRGIFRKSPEHGGFTLACIPCRSWADKVFPELQEEKRLEALWALVLDCMKCGEEDPVFEWERYIENTRYRKEKLDQKKYKAYRFKSRKTDLVLSPAAGARWFGGCNEYPGERIFIPNLPTEEVFCVPHKYSANGLVSSTLPLNYGGKLIKNLTLKLKDGKIEEFCAEEGQEVLEAIISTDEGSHFLGEFALVDQSSPIAQTGRIFNTTLYDENASCHLAIGNAAGQAPEGVGEEQGWNQSRLHVDFMFGSDDLNVYGQTKAGEWEEIMINGHWASHFLR